MSVYKWDIKVRSPKPNGEVHVQVHSVPSEGESENSSRLNALEQLRKYFPATDGHEFVGMKLVS